jgi:hypothetical protein
VVRLAIRIENRIGKTTMRLFFNQSAILLLLATGSTLAAKDKHTKAPAPPDQISVDAHIAASGGPILRFVETRHYDRTYVYAERAAGQPVTLIDVTNTAHPVVLSEVAGNTNLLAVAGTAALSSSGPALSAATAPQTIRVMDLSDPANPKVTRQFDGVTAVEKLAGGIILLANAEGIWVLTQHLAENPAENERYWRKVVYGDSAF